MAPSPRRIARRTAAGALSAALLLSVTACGFDVQTLQPYTAGEGVNVDAGNGDATVLVRNLMILSAEAGSGFLSASLTSDHADVLDSVSGVAIKSDGTDGAAFEANLSSPVTIGDNLLVVLTNQEAITVTSADLKPGLEARLVLSFGTAGTQEIIVPVVDANQPTYATVSPQPAATPEA